MGIRDNDSRYKLYAAHRTALVDYAAPILGSRDEAEDVVQEAFVKFMPAHAERALSPKAYLFRMVRNLAFNLRKRKRYEEKQVTEDAPYWTMPLTVETPEQQALFSDRARRIAATLSGMPAQSRIVVEMYCFDGHTLQEIATHLDISVATAHRLLRAATAELADQMKYDAG